MPQRIFGWFCGISALWLADGLTAVLTRRAPLDFWGLWTRSAGAVVYFAWLSLLGACLLGPLHSQAAAAGARMLDGLGLRGATWGRALASAAVSTLAVLGYRGAVYTATQFHNHELAALLLVVGVGAASALLLAAIRTLTPWLAALVRRWTWLNLPLSFVLYLAAWSAAAWLLWHNRTGFEQLPFAQLTGLCALVCCVPLANGLARHRAWPRMPQVLAGLAVVSLATGLWWGGFPVRAEGDAGWAGMAIARLRQASDVDRDGASAWFGGGDCRPFDPSVHPLALEIIADGIDNNCLGGDRRKPVVSPPPHWSGPPAELPEELSALLLTIDTVRPDHLPMFGYDRDTTPNLAKLAGESVLFERTYTAAPLTRLAVSSLFTSQQASRVKWKGVERSYPLPKIDHEQPWLPHILELEGLRTAAVVPSFSAFERSGHGFDWGFEHYDSSARMQYQGGTMRGFPAEQQVDKAIHWLKKQKKKRFFLWVHLVEPHFEYERQPESPDWGDEPEDLYDAELWQADRQAGRLLDHLRESGRWDDTVVVVAGDHGESFEEAGNRFHGYDLHESGIRTLGMIRAPGLDPGRVKEPISLLDVAPTLLNLLDVEREYEGLRGQNMVPALAGLSDWRPQVVVELFHLPMEGYQLAVIEGDHKLQYVSASRQFIYNDLAVDPGERRPSFRVPSSQGPLLDYLTAVLESTRAEHDAQAREAARLARAEKAEREAARQKAALEAIERAEQAEKARATALLAAEEAGFVPRFSRPLPSLLLGNQAQLEGPLLHRYWPPEALGKELERPTLKNRPTPKSRHVPKRSRKGNTSNRPAKTGRDGAHKP